MNREQYILKHYNRDMKCREVAAVLGMTPEQLKRRVYRLRTKRGFDIPSRPIPGYTGGTKYNRRTKQPDGSWKYTPQTSRRVYQVGDISHRKDGDYRKTETGWESVKSASLQKQAKIRSAPVPKQSPAKAAKVQPQAPQTAKRAEYAATHKPPVENRFNPEKVAVKSQGQGKWIKKDNRTWIFVKQENKAA